MMARPTATTASQAALHRHFGTRHDTFAACLTMAEVHLLNRLREDEAAKFVAAAARRGDELPPNHKRLEALDVLLDQLDASDGPCRLRAREAGARDPFGPDEVAAAIGEMADCGNIVPVARQRRRAA